MHDLFNDEYFALEAQDIKIARELARSIKLMRREIIKFVWGARVESFKVCAHIDWFLTAHFSLDGLIDAHCSRSDAQETRIQK